MAVINAAKEECVNGHPFDERNTYWRPDGNRDCRQCGRARTRRYRDRRPERSAAYKQGWTERNEEKRRAHLALARALYQGTIVRPSNCEECREAGLVHGHHDDYSKPFDVRWLCPLCHRQTHSEEEE